MRLKYVMSGTLVKNASSVFIRTLGCKTGVHVLRSSCQSSLHMTKGLNAKLNYYHECRRDYEEYYRTFPVICPPLFWYFEPKVRLGEVRFRIPKQWRADNRKDPYYLMGYNAVYSAECQPMFRRNISPKSSGSFKGRHGVITQKRGPQILRRTNYMAN
jgi:hypothetical protein